MKHIKVFLLISTLASAVLFGYCIGYVNGCERALTEAHEWKAMYEEHISRQWQMIQHRDTLYVEQLKLRINYKDGHKLEPND